MKGSTEIPHKIIQRYDEFMPDLVQMPSFDAETGTADQRDRWYGTISYVL